MNFDTLLDSLMTSSELRCPCETGQQTVRGAGESEFSRRCEQYMKNAAAVAALVIAREMSGDDLPSDTILRLATEAAAHAGIAATRKKSS